MSHNVYFTTYIYINARHITHRHVTYKSSVNRYTSIHASYVTDLCTEIKKLTKIGGSPEKISRGSGSMHSNLTMILASICHYLCKIAYYNIIIAQSANFSRVKSPIIWQFHDFIFSLAPLPLFLFLQRVLTNSPPSYLFRSFSYRTKTEHKGTRGSKSRKAKRQPQSSLLFVIRFPLYA